MSNTTTDASAKCNHCGKSVINDTLKDAFGNRFCGPCFKWVYGNNMPVVVPQVVPASPPTSPMPPQRIIWC